MSAIVVSWEQVSELGANVQPRGDSRVAIGVESGQTGPGSVGQVDTCVWPAAGSVFSRL